MSAHLPESVDAWRMVAARRSFTGALPVAGLPRLAGLLATDGGSVAYRLEFGLDELGTRYLALEATASVRLLCQRTLEPFDATLQVAQRLGLIADEAEEAGLPPRHEPLLVQGPLRLAEVIEDELLLALPLVPVRPGSEAALAPWLAAGPAGEASAKPFAALQQLKHD